MHVIHMNWPDWNAVEQIRSISEEFREATVW